MRWLWLLACLGCRGGEQPAELRTIVEVPATPSTELDLLFVIDDSNNTVHLQQNLGASLPLLFERLGPLDLHVGVITSDLGTSTSTGDVGPAIGATGSGGCSGVGKGGTLTTSDAPIEGTFLSDVDGQRNFDGDLADLVRQMVLVGSTGCGFEQPLAAMRAALDGNPANAGFVRADATLAVIFLMDEDDCSVRDVSLFGPDTPDNPLQSFRCTRFGVTCLQGGNTSDEMAEPGSKGGCGPSIDASLLDDPAVFRDFLVELKGDPRRVVVGGMIGDPDPFEVELREAGATPVPALARSCTFSDPTGVQGADPGVRFAAFAGLFGDRSATGSICQADLSSPLDAIAARINFAMGSPCITQAVELDRCVVEDLVGDAVIEIPACPAATCWSVRSDPTACPLLDHLALEVTRESPPEAATITRLRCD